MRDKVSFIDKAGQRQEVQITTAHYRKAAAKGLTVRQLINREYPTASDSKYDSFTQMCASAGLYVRQDRALGINSTPLKVIFEEGEYAGAGGSNTLDVNPNQSKHLFPAAVMEYVENKLTVDRGTAVNTFDQMVANVTSVSGARIEQPTIDYTTKDGPEAARMSARAQLAEPQAMMTITASEKTLTIPSLALTLAISDEALQGTTLDLVGLALTRQAEVEGYAQVHEDLLGILQGDADAGSYGTAALAQTKADTLDATITAAGSLSHLAYVKWLYTGLQYRTISHIVTDIAGALAIENRAGRPTNVQENSKDRIDTPAQLIYPNLVDNVKIYVVDAGNSWPANTLMGFDSRYAMQKFINVNARYEDVERWILRRGTAFTAGMGQKVVRIFDTAFSVLSLTTT